MRKILLLIFLFNGAIVKAYSQAPDDSLAMMLVKKHIYFNSMKMSMPGYRVQVHYGNNRAKANEIRTDCIKKFQGTTAYLIYQQPNFKVRLGDFKTRMEAMEFLTGASALYPSAFVVKDEVRLPEIE